METGRCGCETLPAAVPNHQWTPTGLDVETQLTIQPPLLPQKANFAVRVAADEADNDGFLLPALEAVDTSELNAREGLL